jgi:hypothetical protein
MPLNLDTVAGPIDPTDPKYVQLLAHSCPPNVLKRMRWLMGDEQKPLRTHHPPVIIRHLPDYFQENNLIPVGL